MKTSFAIVLLSLCCSLPALADQGVDPAEELKTRIADLERENAMLRQQWGQATMELDRLRKKNDELSRELGELRRAQPAAPAAVMDVEAHPVAKPQAAVGGEAAEGDVASLEAEVARLRAQNEQLTELAGVTPEGERVASAEARITSEAGDGQTFVRSQAAKLRMLSGARADHYLTLGYSYPAGQTPGRATPLTGYLQTAFSGSIHSKADAITITVDGDQTVSLPITDYAKNNRQTGMAGKRRVDKSDETITFLVSPEALDRLAAATSATGRIGDVTFEISREQLALFRAMQKRLEMGI